MSELGIKYARSPVLRHSESDEQRQSRSAVKTPPPRHLSCMTRKIMLGKQRPTYLDSLEEALSRGHKEHMTAAPRALMLFEPVLMV